MNNNNQTSWRGLYAAAAIGLLGLVGCATTTADGGSFLQDNTLFGKEMGTLATVSPASVSALRQQQCTVNAAPCQKLFNDHLAGKDHKALAVPVAELGVGVSAQKERPQHAFLNAVYACNHASVESPRLCEVQIVDGKDIRPWTSAALAGHRQAQARLTVPGQRFFAGEEAGGGGINVVDLRAGTANGMTPQHLEGVATLHTQDLAQALMGADPPLVIDVGSSYDVIPMARSLYRGGLAFDDAALDKAYETRFAGLLRQLSPDMSKPVVFYCRGRECWFSVNAALRAKRLGYTRVAWYRGGIHSWKAAGLPVATAVVKAVAQP